MASSLNNLAIPSGPEVYWTDAFKNMIEDHLEWLREHPDTTVVEVDPQKGYKNDYDLIGLLIELGVRSEHHWIVMRTNGYKDHTEYRSTTDSLLMPSEGAIRLLVSRHNVNRE